MSVDTSFGRWLQQRRKSLGLTQANLAQCVGCATVTIHKIELEERRPSTAIAERLAACLQIADAERPAFLRCARGAAPLLSQVVSMPPLPARSSVPVPLTPLLGRARELAAVADLVRRPDVRLVTLTGAGGTGKTRLALQVAEELLAVFPDGVWFVDLAPIRDPDLVATAIARTLQVKAVGGEPITERLAVQLRDRQVLPVLDNFEQVVVAAPLVTGLLKAARGLKVLVTSRMPLHLTGEHELSVPPLALPDLARLPALDVLTQYPAVALFIQRVQQITPDFHVTDATGPVVAEICQRLDGLPLAIELAARRSKLFTPQALLARLRAQLSWLSGGPRDLPARQQTLWATIAWSYQLLEPAEQQLFTRLGVFVGGWTLAAAEAVCVVDDRLTVDVVAGLQALNDQSLVRPVEGAGAERRFTMLETIREYAVEQLERSVEAETLRRRHADHCIALAEAAYHALWGPHEREQFDRLEREHDNLRAALGYLLTRHDTEGARRLSADLALFWHGRGYRKEGRRWLHAALAMPGAASSYVQMRALAGAGWLALFDNDYAPTAGYFEEALALGRALGDAREIGNALRGLANGLLAQGTYAQAETLVRESLALGYQAGDSLGVGFSLQLLEAVAAAHGDDAQVLALKAQALAVFRQGDHPGPVAMKLAHLGQMAMRRGDDAQARVLFHESLALHQHVAWLFVIRDGLVGMAELAVRTGRADVAARLFGVLAAMPEDSRLDRDPDYERYVAVARTQLDAATWQAAWTAGQAMPLEQAIAYALEQGT